MSSSELTKFIELKIKLDELQDRYEKYRKIIEDHMIKENITSIEHSIDNQKYKIKKSLLSRESISKKELPKDIWDKYCKSSSYTTLRITKIKL
jgi:uncharacterized protein Yka (UPF0111/DUF47 family)